MRVLLSKYNDDPDDTRYIVYDSRTRVSETIPKDMLYGQGIQGVTDDELTCFETFDGYCEGLEIQHKLFGDLSVDMYRHGEHGLELIGLPEECERDLQGGDTLYLADYTHRTAVEFRFPAYILGLRKLDCTGVDYCLFYNKRLPKDLSAYFWVKEIGLPLNFNITSKAFNGASHLQTVSVNRPSTIPVPDASEDSYIGSSAFRGCINLKSIDLTGFNVAEIPESCFEGCRKLEHFGMPDGLGKIGFRAFYRCSKLTEFELPTSVHTVGGSAFAGSGLRSFALPKDTELTNFGGGAFAGCTSLKEVDLTYLKELDNSEIFAGCHALQKITLGEDLRALSLDVFSGLESLHEIEIPAQLTKHSISIGLHPPVDVLVLLHEHTATTLGIYDREGISKRCKNLHYRVID